jgi:hypothetical protein
MQQNKNLPDINLEVYIDVVRTLIKPFSANFIREVSTVIEVGRTSTSI